MYNIYRNKKTGDNYLVTGTRINTTNTQDRQIMIEYESLLVKEVVINDAVVYTNKFVSEATEFYEKFEKVS